MASFISGHGAVTAVSHFKKGFSPDLPVAGKYRR
jgi:hypothetical protein